MVSRNNGCAVAEGSCRIVSYDFTTATPTPLPLDLIESVLKLQGVTAAAELCPVLKSSPPLRPLRPTKRDNSQ